MRVIKDTTPTARKDYRCDACDQLLAYMVYPDEFDESDIKIMEKAKKNGWLIKAGDKYSKQVNIYEGELCTFRAIPEILPIYSKYEISDLF